jgi:flagellar assembly protein FliH
MKQFRPYHFPPLAQFAAPGPHPAAADGQWQRSVAEGFDQGQRDGYETGMAHGRQDGFEAGRADGLAQGRDAARAEAAARYDELGRPIDNLLKNLKKLRTDYLVAQRKEVVDLVAKVARQVIRAELALQPVQLLALVDEALASMPPTRDQIEVSLNPEELKRITELDPRRAKRWNLLADPSLDAGECRVKAGDHEVDAGCHHRLAACIEQVSTQLEQAGEEQAA